MTLLNRQVTNHIGTLSLFKFTWPMEVQWFDKTWNQASNALQKDSPSHHRMLLFHCTLATPTPTVSARSSRPRNAALVACGTNPSPTFSSPGPRNTRHRGRLSGNQDKCGEKVEYPVRKRLHCWTLYWGVASNWAQLRPCSRSLFIN